MIDYHIHTTVSPDAEQALGDVVNRARELGLTHIAITDHYEFMDGVFYDRWKIRDLEKYGREIDEYNSRYKDIYIAKGIEVGRVNKNKEQIKKVLDTIDFDFIIDSAHFVDDMDPYYPEYFYGKTKEQAYHGYLREISESIDYMDDRVSIIGHIGYIARYSPYDDYELRYEEFKDIFDELLIKAVRRGIGIEINTSNFGRKRDELMPPVSIIKRYRQLGGEILTIGSDSHRVSDIGKGFETARQIALEAGFKYLSVFKNLKEEKLPL